MTSTLLRRWLLALGLAASSTLQLHLRAASSDSPLLGFMSAPTADLLTALRPQLVNRLASGSSAAPAANATQFHPSGGRLILAQVVHAMSTDASAEKIYRESIEQAFTGYEQQAAAGGFPNDVAGALALFVASAELGATGTEMTDAQSNVIVRQLQAALDTPEMRAAPDPVKQELYEFFGTFGLYLLITRQIAIEGHNDNALARLKPLSAQSLGLVLGISPDAVQLTDSGLRITSVAAAPMTPAANPGNVAAGSPAAPVVSAGATSIVGTWHGIGISTTNFAVTNAAGTGNSMYGIKSELAGKDLVFFASGWFTTLLPSTGLTGVDPVKASAADPYFWGHYTFDGQHGMLNFTKGTPESFEFVDGKILFHKFEYSPRGPIK